MFELTKENVIDVINNIGIIFGKSFNHHLVDLSTKDDWIHVVVNDDYDAIYFDEKNKVGYAVFGGDDLCVIKYIEHEENSWKRMIFPIAKMFLYHSYTKTILYKLQDENGGIDYNHGCFYSKNFKYRNFHWKNKTLK